MKLNEILKLIALIILCQLAGIIGSIFTISSISSWYAFLNKPFFNPPSWLFGPVWISLYALMGISLYLIWSSKNSSEKSGSLKIFGIQLVLNALWSIFFFGLQNLWLAFVEIIILWFAIFFTIKKSLKVSKKSAYLLIPYLLWVSFAAILNLSIALLN